MKEDFEDNKEKKFELKQFTVEEIVNFRREIEKYNQITRTFNWPEDIKYDQYITRLEQYMESLGVIKFDDQGKKVCMDSEGYDRLNKLNEVIERRDYAIQMTNEARNPALKAKRLEKVTAIGNELRGLKDKLKV